MTNKDLKFSIYEVFDSKFNVINLILKKLRCFEWKKINYGHDLKSF